MAGRRAEAQSIVCRNCPDVVLAVRYPSGNVYVIVPGSEWQRGQVVVYCPECRRRARIRLTPEREAA